MKKFNITVNGKTYEVDVEEIKNGVVQGAAPVASQTNVAPVIASAPKKEAVPTGATSINSPMPGTIVDVKVSVGASVKKGDVVCILEAMKMENEIMAPSDGKVVGVSVAKGSSVNSGDVLVSLA